MDFVDWWQYLLILLANPPHFHGKYFLLCLRYFGSKTILDTLDVKHLNLAGIWQIGWGHFAQPEVQEGHLQISTLKIINRKLLIQGNSINYSRKTSPLI